jgi:hypothetical protein
VNKKNQISLIKEFVRSNEENILLNQVSDEIAIFYLGVIKHYANNQGIKICDDNHIQATLNNEDLFGSKIIQTFSITNAKRLDTILDARSKKIVFTDYKNYKRLSSKFNSINSYQFENDIDFFIQNELKINNEELLDFCKNNPTLLFSETSKFLVNKNLYSSDTTLVDEKNHVLNIRKSIFENKRNNFNIKSLYSSIKKEAEYKKLSFLTY